MRNLRLCLFLAALLCANSGIAQTTIDANHMAPTGKGWGEATHDSAAGVQNGAVQNSAVPQYGIFYHGGPVMVSPARAYFIWYGNWINGPQPSDSQSTVTLLDQLFAPTGGIAGSPYEKINTTYMNSAGYRATGSIALAASATVPSTLFGTSLTDSNVRGIVAHAVATGALPADKSGVYFVLTSSDINETSGFCTQYCGWHSWTSINTIPIKFAFIGNTDRCPAACAWQTLSPNGNSGADGMANIMAHEADEAITDPRLSAWYDKHGLENADKCAWLFGPVKTTATGAQYNQTFGNYKWLIQLNWDNQPGPGCTQAKGGTRYTF